MSVSLQKGQKISLSKEKAGLSSVIVGLGWDEASVNLNSKSRVPIDCDASALLLKGGRLMDQKDIVYFANLYHASGTVEHMGDNVTGAGDGDDEQIYIDLDRVPAEYDKIVIVVNVFNAVHKQQHFGMIQNAFIRIMDEKTKQELCRYNLSDDYTGMTAMIFGEVYRYNGEWKFNAVGMGTTDDGLKELTKRYM